MNPAEQDLTLLSGRDMVLSLWYSDSQLENGSSVNSDNFEVQKRNGKRLLLKVIGPRDGDNKELK